MSMRLDIPMRRFIPLALGAVATVLASLCVPAGAAPLINGSFETEDYTGWTLFEDSGFPDAGTWGIAATGATINPGDSTFDFFHGVNVVQGSIGLPITYTATDGNFVAYQLQNGSEQHRMYQDVALDPTTTTLCWDMQYNNHNIVFDAGLQYLAVNIRDLSDNVLQTLFVTTEGTDPASIPMTAFTADISAYAGTTVRVDINLQAQFYYFDATFDHFRVGTGPSCVCQFSTGGCKTAGKSLLLLKNDASDDSKDKLTWKWLKGAATSLEDLGIPTGTTNYTLCLYAGTSTALVAVPAGSNWQTAGSKGFKFKDPSGTPNGAQKALLKSGDAGKSKALVKGKGTNLPDVLAPALPLPVTAQLVNDTNSTCFEAVYNSLDVIKNDSKQFKAKK